MHSATKRILVVKDNDLMKLLDDVLEAPCDEAMSSGRGAEAVEHGKICLI